MAKGRKHDRINLIVGSVTTGLLIGIERSPLIIIGFIAGFLLATLVISPDLDLGPKKRTGWLQFVLYPYAIFFRHRGYSHSILFGTITRVLYGIFVLLMMIFILNKMDYVELKATESFWGLVEFFRRYDYKLTPYKLMTWTFVGMFLADLIHIFTDQLSSFWGRLRRKLS